MKKKRFAKLVAAQHTNYCKANGIKVSGKYHPYRFGHVHANNYAEAWEAIKNALAY